MAFSLHNHCLCRILGRAGLCSVDRRCTWPDWHAAGQQVSLLFFLWLLSDRSRDKPEPAQDRGIDQQNLRSTAELEQLSAAGFRGKLPNICSSKTVDWWTSK